MDVLPLGLSLFEVLVVTLSWLAVGLFGMWCLNVFKPFHASKSKAWTIACTVVYLATFVVSGSLFELMVFEIYDFLPRPARLRYWRFALALLSVLLKAIVPFLLVASVLKQQGLSSVLSLWLSVPFLLLYWVMLWQIGLYLPVEKGAQPEVAGDGGEESIFDFLRDAMDVGKSVSRLSVVGVTTAALFSGFGAVNFPLEQLLVSRGVDPAVLSLKERMYKELLETLVSKKVRLCQEEQRNARVVHMGQRIKYATSPPTSNANGQVPGAAPQRRRSYPHQQQGLNPGVEKRMKMLKDDIVLTEQLASELFLEIVWIRELQKQASFAQTRHGKLLRYLSYVLSLYCIVRVGAAIASVLALYNVGTPSDSINRALEFVFLQLGIPVDFAFWTPLLSFSLVVGLALLQVRGFLVTMYQVSHIGVFSTSTEVYSLLLAYLAGTYFVASVLLLRTHLPHTFRRVLSVILGPQVQFGFFHRWFDFIFLGSVAVSVFVLFVSHKHKLQAVQQATSHVYS